MADKFNSFTSIATQKYEDFRDRANQVYADFMRNAWEEMDLEPPLEMFEDQKVEPVIVEEDDFSEEEGTNAIAVFITADMVAPKPKPQPLPIAPIKEFPWPEQPTVATTFYGTTAPIRFDDSQRFTLKDLSNDELADTWLKCSTRQYNNTISDCLAMRDQMALNDWAYLRFLLAFARSVYDNENDALFLAGYIYTQSGYQMRLYREDANHLRLLYSSKERIHGFPYITRDNVKLYSLKKDLKSLDMCNASFEQEQPLTLFMPVEPSFSKDYKEMRVLQSKRYPDVTAQVAVDQNIVDFYNDYPQFTIGEDKLSRWFIYANMPLDARVKEQLYPDLKKAIEGCDQRTAVNKLLNFVQTALTYEYDEKVWGYDRPFFAEETLFYPYCDCEDRAVLFTRLVRDLIGIPTALIYYPGHLGAAIALDEEGWGDTVEVDGRKYTIADPTYIGSRVGQSMKQMPVTKATAILLKD